MRTIAQKVMLPILLTIFLAFTMGHTPLDAHGGKHDQELFFAGANAVADGQYVRARILLNTLISTYPESRLAGQARMLVFYSYARESRPADNQAPRILQEVEEYVRAHQSMPSVP